MKRLIYLLLSLLGLPLASCEPAGLVDAYGPPYATFEPKDRVAEDEVVPAKSDVNGGVNGDVNAESLNAEE